MREIAISDLHGCVKSFKQLLELIAFSKEDQLYLLGDYIDRGPDSKGVIDHIWHLQEEGYALRCIRGNHEQLMLEAQFGQRNMDLWFRNGGRATLDSFGAAELSDVHFKYTEWIKGLPFYIATEKHILIHAGFNFEKEDPFQERYAMIWRRNWYDLIDRDWLGERIIIHGHTPSKREEIEAALINLNKLPALVIDNGCVYSHRAGQAHLCAFDMTNRQLYFQANVDVKD